MLGMDRRKTLLVLLLPLAALGTFALYRAVVSGRTGAEVLSANQNCVRLFEAMQSQTEAGADLAPAFHIRFAGAKKVFDELGEEGAECLRAAVGHPDESLRAFAIIFASQEHVFPPEQLEEWLSDGNPGIRSAAVEALGRPGRESRIGAILGMLDDSDTAVRQTALRALRNYRSCRGPDRDRVDARCVAALNDPDVNIQREAAATLGVLNVTTAAAPIKNLLSGPDTETRVTAIYALKNLHARETAPDILPFVSDPDDQVAVAAMLALGVMRYREAVPAITARLEDMEPAPRARALRALAMIEETEETVAAAEQAEDVAPPACH